MPYLIHTFTHHFGKLHVETEMRKLSHSFQSTHDRLLDLIKYEGAGFGT